MGYKVKEARKAAGLSQEELSRKSGVARSIISGLESGRVKETTTKTLAKIAHALNTSIDNIFFEECV